MYAMFMLQIFLILSITIKTDGPSGPAVYGVGLRPVACWECVFESRRGHGCLSLVTVVCCQVGVSATGPIPRPEESYRVCVCVSECDQV
jgi:hypothetical protein